MQQLLRTQPESSAARATERGASTGKAKRDLDLSLNLPRLRGSRSHEHRRRTTTSHAATVRDQSANRTQWFCAPAQHVINDATKLAASHTTDSTRGCNLDGTTLLTNVQFVVDLCAVAVTLQSRRVRRSGGRLAPLRFVLRGSDRVRRDDFVDEIEEMLAVRDAKGARVVSFEAVLRDPPLPLVRWN